MSKKNYWIKLTNGFFDRPEIKLLESQTNGPLYLLFYLKLLTLSIEQNGFLRVNDNIAYNFETLAVITNINVDIVKQAMIALKNLNLIDYDKNTTILVKEAAEMFGSETKWAEYKRKERSKAEKLKNENLEIGHCPKVSKKCPTELELDIDLDIDIQKEKGILTYSQKEKKKEDLKKEILEEKEVDFESFWNIYPRKVAKKDCKAWFLKNKPDKELIKKMILAVKQQKTSIAWVKDEGQFIPYPLTWLNREGWNDQLTYTTKKGEDSDDWYARIDN